MHISRLWYKILGKLLSQVDHVCHRACLGEKVVPGCSDVVSLFFLLNCCHILQSASLDMQALSLGNQTNNGCTTLVGMLCAAYIIYKLAQITEVALTTHAHRCNGGSSLTCLPAGAAETTKDPPPPPPVIPLAVVEI